MKIKKKRTLTKAEKIELCERIIKGLKSGFLESGLCNCLAFVAKTEMNIHFDVSCNARIMKEVFTEFLEFEPKYKVTDSLWFWIDKRGIKLRIEILEKVLKKLKD